MLTKKNIDDNFIDNFIDSLTHSVMGLGKRSSAGIRGSHIDFTEAELQIIFSEVLLYIVRNINSVTKVCL